MFVTLLKLYSKKIKICAVVTCIQRKLGLQIVYCHQSDFLVGPADGFTQVETVISLTENSGEHKHIS